MSGIPDSSFSSGASAMTASVVRNNAAIDPAFCKAERVTFAASITPAFTKSSYSPVEAFKPLAPLRFLTFSTTTPPSKPALTAIWCNGPSSALATMRAPVASSW